MGILQLISSESFITYNKTLAKKLGIYETILLGELCSISSLFKSDTFFFTRDKIENDTCLSEYQIKQATEHLKSLGVITTERKGIPCKLYYTLHEDIIISLVQDSKTSCKNTDDPVSENSPNCSDKNSLTISNNTNNKTSSNNINSESKQSDDCEKEKKEAASKRNPKRGKTKEELDRINDTKTVMQCFFDNYTKLTGLRYEIKGDVSKYYASSNSFIHKKLASYSASQLCTVLTRYADDPWYKEHAQYELMIILSEKNCIKFLSDTYRPSKTDNGFDVNKVGLVGYVGKKTGDKDEEYYGVRDADVPDVSSVGDIIKRLAEPGVPPVKEI